jgi:pseudouridine synthase
MSIVLQKFIADSGHCSRREAERLIREGKVRINNKTAELGMRANPRDKVFIGKKRIFTKRENIYIVLNKPEGYVCTNRNFEDEKNIFSLIALKERLFTVGRLDKNSRGLVFLTNDGALAERLSHPRYGHEKEYEVKVKKEDLNEEEIIRKFRKGVDIGEGDGYVRAKAINYLGDNKFRIILTEGKKRQIRRMFRACACEVVDLVRTRIGSGEGEIKLGKLPEGEWKFLEEQKIKSLVQ